MKKLTIATVMATSLMAGQSFADSNPWKECGIGAMIFDDNGTAAAISNIIWDLGTTAVSSQISSEDTCEGKSVETAMFIQDNYNSIIEETSQGSGEHLTSLLDMLEVDADSQPATIAMIRQNVGIEVKNSKATPENYYAAVMASL